MRGGSTAVAALSASLFVTLTRNHVLTLSSAPAAPALECVTSKVSSDMGHSVTAILSSRPAVDSILRSSPGLVAVPLVDGWSLIPLDDAALDSVASDYSKTADGFNYLSPSLEVFLAGHSQRGALVYFETGYFGGEGSQAAAAYQDGHPLPPTPSCGEGAINRALGCLGITRHGAFDEFDQIGLNRYRHTSDWIEAAILKGA